MQTWLADPSLLGGPGQGSRQILELLISFGLTALIGLEREIHGKSAGLRTQTIVGTAAALISSSASTGSSTSSAPEPWRSTRRGWPPRSSRASDSWVRA